GLAALVCDAKRVDELERAADRDARGRTAQEAAPTIYTCLPASVAEEPRHAKGRHAERDRVKVDAALEATVHGDPRERGKTCAIEEIGGGGVDRRSLGLNGRRPGPDAGPCRFRPEHPRQQQGAEERGGRPEALLREPFDLNHAEFRDLLITLL